MELGGSIAPARLRRIDTLTWYAMFPGGFLVIGLGLYYWLSQQGPMVPADNALLAMRDTIQTVLYAALLLATGLGLVLKTRLFAPAALKPPGVAEPADVDALFRMFQARKFILAGLIDAPMVIAFGMAMFLNAPLLALTAGLWSLVPALFCRPDLERSLRAALAFNNRY